MLWAYQRSKFLNVPETFTQLGSFWGTVAFKIICSLYCASYVEALWNSKEKHTELEISTATHYDYVPVCTCLNVAHYGVLFFFTVFNNPLRRLMYLLCMHVCSPLVQFLYILPHMPNGSLLLIFLFISMFLPTPLCLGASRGWCLDTTYLDCHERYSPRNQSCHGPGQERETVQSSREGTTWPAVLTWLELQRTS